MRYFYIIFLVLMAWSSNAQNQDDVRLAYAYYNSGEYEKAAYLFENLYAQTNSRGYFNYYITCLIKDSQFEKAEKAVKKQMSSNKTDKTYNIILGNIYNKSNRSEKATEQFETIFKDIPVQRNTVINLANQFSSIEEYGYAEKILLQSGEQNGENYDFELMSIYSQAHNSQKMIDKGLDIVHTNPQQAQMIQNNFQYYLNTDVNDEFYEKLRLTLLQRVQKNPTTAFSEMLVWLFVQKKNFKSALIQAKALDKRLGESGQRLISLGDLALESRDYAAAIDAYKYVADKGSSVLYYQKARFGQLRASFLQIENGGLPDNSVLQSLKSQYASMFKEYGVTNATLPEVVNYSKLLTYYLNSPTEAIQMLENALSLSGLTPAQKAVLMLQLGDIQLYTGDVWAATMTYAKVENDNKQNANGDEAKFRKAHIAYYTGNFKWAASQLDVLKQATSKLIANDAMELSMLINDNCDRDEPDENDTTSAISEDMSKNAELRVFARAELYFSQNKNDLAMASLDTIINNYSKHSLVDEAYYKKAEIFEKNMDYVSAANCLDSVVSNYAYDVLADKAAFKLAGLCYEKLDDPERAKKLYLKILADYPGSVFAVESRKKYREIEAN